MDRGEFDYQRRTGSVKAAVKKSHSDIPDKYSSRGRKLHMARREIISRSNESRKAAEFVKTEAESELSIARTAVKDFASQIEEMNYEAKSRARVLEKSSLGEENVLGGRIVVVEESLWYAEVMRELVCVKQELRKLKLDMGSVLEEKSRAEEEIEALSLKVCYNSSSVEALTKEIEEVNEEQLLVELARIEALKEYGEIEAEREKEANEFSCTIKKAKKKTKGLTAEVDHFKELENKLAVTLYDVNFLQNEQKNVKDQDKRIQLEALESPHLFVSITEELEAANKELALIKDEEFRFMGSMDVIRNELKHVREETARLRKAEEKLDLTVQSLHSKPLGAKSKLEAETAAAEKASGIASNLALTLERLKTEVEAAKKEEELVTEETARIKEKIQKTESEIDLTEERIKTTMQELNSVKSSEALALENLKSLIEKTILARASASQNDSWIIISKFEYEYLTTSAIGAEELARKKIAAAQAWMEALKASEKEILMKIEIAQKEIRETTVEGEKQVFKTKRTHSTKRRDERESRNQRQKSERTAEAENLQGLARKFMKAGDNPTPIRRAKSQRPASPATGMTRSTSFAIKKKAKTIPSFTKPFSGKRIE